MSWDGINRRRFERVQIPITIHIHNPKEIVICTYTRDVCEEGIKIELREPLEMFSLVDLEIYARPKPIFAKGKVAWMKKKKAMYLVDDFVYEVGIECKKLDLEDKTLIQRRISSYINAESSDQKKKKK